MRSWSTVVLPILVCCWSCTATVHRPPRAALGPYSASVTRGGLTFVSGQIGAVRGAVEFEEEASSAIDAVEAELARAGLGLEHCLSVTVYLTDLALYSEFNAIYGRRFVPPPARACVAVEQLPGGAHVEIQVIAAAN